MNVRRRMMDWLAPLAVAAIVGFVPAPAWAQEPAPEGAAEGGSGRPLDGYIATGVLVAGALFVVGKSARR
jgi:hypothetical protein